MNTPLIAYGAGEGQGAIILAAIALPVVGLTILLFSRRKREGASIPGLVFSAISFLFSLGILSLFGWLPHTVDYWGAYIPHVPLLLSIAGIMLSLPKKRPNK